MAVALLVAGRALAGTTYSPGAERFGTVGEVRART